MDFKLSLINIELALSIIRYIEIKVKQMYASNAINVETHLENVWRKYPGFNGVSMPSFLPETG